MPKDDDFARPHFTPRDVMHHFGDTEVKDDMETDVDAADRYYDEEVETKNVLSSTSTSSSGSGTPSSVVRIIWDENDRDGWK